MSNTKAIKEIAVTYREYYKLFKNSSLQKLKTLDNECKSLNEEVNKLKERIIDNKDVFKKNLKLDLDKYKDYLEDNNTFKELTKKSVSLYITTKKDNELFLLTNILYTFCKKVKQLKELLNEYKIIEYCAGMKMEEYKEYLKKYFTQVHKEMILNGYGYVISPTIGYVCFNRCKLRNPKKKIDWKKTNENKKKLLAEGKTLYDEDAAEFARVNGLDYDGVDYRVYLNAEYVYETPLINGRFKNAYSSKFILSDYRSREIRGKSNEELIAECNNDLNKIIELPVDIRTKLNMCVSISPVLQSKFIRNEYQEPIATSKAYRKNRQ